MRIQIINGPNINLLGKREPSIYGSVTFEDFLIELRANYPDVEISYYQSNTEGELIDKIQETGFDVDGIILNAGASRILCSICLQFHTLHRQTHFSDCRHSFL